MAYSREIIIDDGTATEYDVRAIIADALMRDRRDLPETFLVKGPYNTQVIVDLTGEGLAEEQEMYDALYEVYGNSVDVYAPR